MPPFRCATLLSYSQRLFATAGYDGAVANKKVALIMGVANHRSVAWACVESFVARGDFDVVVTFQSERQRGSIDKLTQQSSIPESILASVACNVETDIPELFSEHLPTILRGRTINAVVHSIAYGNVKDKLLDATWTDFCQAQHVSAYSLVETARHARTLLSPESSSITAISYLGAVRAVPNYNLMGPAKASLEAIIRALAAELGNNNVRVNAVSAGPMQTVSARSIPNFQALYHATVPPALGRHVTQQQVADTVRFLATDGTGISGQTIYVDGGFNTSVSVPTRLDDNEDE
jgi:enoyl-[acyl-carrier protein] reductase I